MFKYLLQWMTGLFIFTVSTFIAWYEGSAVIEDSLEWKYSTPFTQILNVEITNGYEISQFDYFVYAVKFQPLFPTIMLVSALYILCVAGYYLIKHKSNWATYFWASIGLIMIILSGLLFNSSTNGGSILFWVTSVSGLMFIVVSILLRSSHFKHKLNENINEM